MKKRSEEIDITKGLLTIGMVLAHAIQLLSSGQSRVLNAMSLGANFVSFSGFMFCFGFASWAAYLSQPRLPWPSILRTSVRCYAAFVISGVAFRILVDSVPPSLELIVRVALIRDIPGYSEFLLSFAVITILGAIFRDAIRRATDRLPSLVLAFAVCLAVTFLPSENRYDPVVGQLIGGQGFAFFPTVPYLPLFLLGVFTARHASHVNTQACVLALFAVVVFCGLTALEIPIGRFPPSALWVVCSAGLAYLYYGLSNLVQTYAGPRIKGYFIAVGQHVLRYLLLSNLAFFGCAPLGLRASFGAVQTEAFFAALMAGIYLTHSIPAKFERDRQSIERAA